MMLRVKPGEWIRVPVDGYPFPSTITVGGDTTPAFVDHEQTSSGVQPVVARRCPDLKPGRHSLTVVTPTGTFDGHIIITR